MLPSDPAAWPLIGRGGEIERIAAARTDKACRGVVVMAGAGIGKSHLVREACAAAERDGALVHWAQATSSAAKVPLGAFIGLSVEARSSDALELMRRGADALREQAEGRKVVLGVDDAQLLDSVSAALVLHLTTTQSAFVLATVRAGDPCPDAIVSLWKDAGAQRLDLAALSDETLTVIVETALDGPLDQKALAWVLDSSRGNILYAKELVRGAVEAEALTLKDGLWRLARSPPLGSTLRELVGQRMSGLTAAQRAPLELLALGEPLQLDELVRMTSRDALTEVESLGLITVDTPAAKGGLRLSHPLYGEVMRDAMPVLHGLRLRLRLAGTVQAREPFTPDDALLVARWLIDAGGAIPPALLLDAARAASLAGDPDLCAQLAEQAIADGAGTHAALLLARAHTARKRFGEAEEVLGAVEVRGDLHEGSCADADRVDYLEQRLQVLFWGLDRASEAHELLERALTWSASADWPQQVEPLRLGFPTDITESADTLRALLADPALGEDTRRMTKRQLAASLFFTGHTREAYALARRLLPGIPLRGYGDAFALAIWRLIALETGEDWDGLDASMGQTLHDAIQANDHEASGQAAYCLGYTQFLRGRYRDAARWVAEADLHFEHQDTFGSLVLSRALRVGIEYHMSDLPGAAAALDRFRATLDGRTPVSSQLPYLARAEGWGALARGDVQGARQRFLGAATAQDARPAYAAQLLYEAMRAGAPAGPIAAEHARLAQRCDSRLVAAYAAHSAARAADDGVALMAVAEQMVAVGALRYAMEAAVSAASVFLDAGRQDSARRAAARARALHVPDQGAQPPRISGMDSVETALTDREAQITALAARGLSNTSIADQLVLSVRTVESHVYRAMQKLGVTDRKDL